MAANSHTIHLAGPNYYHEETAGGAITPGFLVEKQSDGKYHPHSSAAKGGSTFAIEQALLGETIDDAYADEDSMRAITMQAGSKVNAYLASGENVADATELASNGDGYLAAAGSGDVVVAFAEEAVDASAAAARIEVRVVPNYQKT